ncbi:hypothetical protein FE257_013042 [Aspergillus nanangensis]|uniref:Uncharacterized protein n=1 Tax=Aspergillus nanangensis TaxID=2582783 RepID=A0AAD4GQC6_ASPNN|nr:hypothetical protein FE257_013042 [Aspergillus nanangensis]
MPFVRRPFSTYFSHNVGARFLTVYVFVDAGHRRGDTPRIRYERARQYLRDGRFFRVSSGPNAHSSREISVEVRVIEGAVDFRGAARQLAINELTYIIEDIDSGRRHA